MHGMCDGWWNIAVAAVWPDQRREEQAKEGLGFGIETMGQYVTPRRLSMGSMQVSGSYFFDLVSRSTFFRSGIHDGLTTLLASRLSSRPS
jgi:hypothetical protein